MLKKLFATFLATFVLASCGSSIEKTDPKKSVEEIKFEESGRAKAIENETDLWQIYENAKTGFSFKFPHNFAIDENLRIQIDAIDALGKQPLNFTTATAQNNRDALARNEFGEEIDWPLAISEKVKNIGELNAQDFLVVSRFEVCDVTFERKLIFYANDRQIVFTLVGDRDEIIAENSEFFTTNVENCGDEQIWDFEKQNDFYEKLANKNGGAIAQKWFDDFDAIVATLEFFEPTVAAFDAKKLEGVWTSLDDELSTIEFLGDEKIDFYENKEMSRRLFAISGDKLLTVDENGNLFEYRIHELSNKNLVLMFLPRGNILRYSK